MCHGRVMTSVGTSRATDGLARLLTAGRWTHPPRSVTDDDGRLVVMAVEGSDAWRHTSYGFVHDSEHALLEPFGEAEALEVSFLLDFQEQFDQAGVFLRASEYEWIKAGIEASDGQLQVGAVVTHVTSDWSVAPVQGCCSRCDWRSARRSCWCCSYRPMRWATSWSARAPRRASKVPLLASWR